MSEFNVGDKIVITASRGRLISLGVCNCQYCSREIYPGSMHVIQEIDTRARSEYKYYIETESAAHYLPAEAIEHVDSTKALVWR